VAQNLKYDMLVLERYGVSVQGPQFDTMLAHFLLESDLRHGMDYMAETLLHYRPQPITDLIGPKGKTQKNMRSVPVEIAAEYAAEDADITWQLHELLAPRLKEKEQESSSRKWRCHWCACWRTWSAKAFAWMWMR
jgi:DNA polymerase-1